MSEMLRLRWRMTDLAPGLRVRRVLPALERRAVGPFWAQHRFAPIPGETDRIEAPPWRD
jgi:hypothetical protein